MEHFWDSGTNFRGNRRANVTAVYLESSLKGWESCHINYNAGCMDLIQRAGVFLSQEKNSLNNY